MYWMLCFFTHRVELALAERMQESAVSNVVLTHCAVLCVSYLMKAVKRC
jgi:hypothetical protein